VNLQRLGILFIVKNWSEILVLKLSGIKIYEVDILKKKKFS
jgi:hypothetical protein